MNHRTASTSHARSRSRSRSHSPTAAAAAADTPAPGLSTPDPSPRGPEHDRISSQAQGQDAWERVGARAAFDVPGTQRPRSARVVITRPLTPSGAHLAESEPPAGWFGGSGLEDSLSASPGILAPEDAPFASPGFLTPESGVVRGAAPRAMPPRPSLKRDRSSDGGGPAEPKHVRGGDGIKTDAPENDADPRLRNAQGEKTSILRDRQVDAFSDDSGGLPAEKGFPIQIGSELFRLSGASIMSDAPSYFSRFFQDQMRQPDHDGRVLKTLYIDRDPVTFQDIALHLQGYYVKPRDGAHYVRLFSDAQFYSLPKLIKQLFETDICIHIGERDFVVPRDLFATPGNSPNYFTLGFAVFTHAPGSVFPGLERANLFRPPSIDPPALLQRSAAVFADLLDLLRGYELRVRDAAHRAALLRDCRYYHLRGLEQSLLPHRRGYNLARRRTEIALRLEDIRQSGLSFVADPPSDAAHATPSDAPYRPARGYVHYARPFVDDTPAELILELGPACARLDPRAARLALAGTARARLTSLLHVVATKMNLPSTAPLGLLLRANSSSGDASGVATATANGSASNATARATEPAIAVDDDDRPGPASTPLADTDRVRVRLGAEAHVVLDGCEYVGLPIGAAAAGEATDAAPEDGLAAADCAEPDAAARDPQGADEWLVRRGQWRLCIRPRDAPAGCGDGSMEVVLEGVKVDAVRGERGENGGRGWVGDE